MRLPSWSSILVLIGLGASACQDYPFEPRRPRRSDVRKISEAVLTVRPTDILFVVDNSGTMGEEREAIRHNLSAFLDRLVDSATDFQIGVITTDVECNLPGDRDCTAGGASQTCCARRGESTCTDDLATGYTDCDGGRLRSATGLDRIFRRPETDREAWKEAFAATIGSFDCNVNPSFPPLKPEGSAYEAGLEAALRAVACSVGESCPDPAVAQLNAGFVRPEADLVIIFITDEDDCSFRDASAYRSVVDGSDPNEQATRLCGPDECYAHHGAHLDADGDGLMDWADPGTAGYFKCPSPSGLVGRATNPPLPDSIHLYLDALVAAKGGDVNRIRAAGILSGVVETDGSFRDSGCFADFAGPSAACQCLSMVDENIGPFCELTALAGHSPSEGHIPSRQDTAPVCNFEWDILGGCTSMPGSRYSAFLRELGNRRAAAGAQRDVLVDSICQWGYDDTLFRIVNNVIIRNCFELGSVPGQASDITVKLNGATLANVEPGSLLPGWSWRSGTGEICLEGGLHKNVHDRFEIFVLSPEP